jgi:sulfur carrier protein
MIMSVPHRDVTPRSMPPATSILVNGDTCSVRATRLDLILAELGYGEGRVATALNGAFIPAGRRAEIHVASGDRIEVVSARQGG